MRSEEALTHVDTKQLEGIEGWLVFPALYLVIAAFATAEYVIDAQLPALRPEVLAGNLAVLAGAVVMLALFFQKRAVVPSLMIVFYVLCVGVTSLEYLSLTHWNEGIDPGVVSAELAGVREGLGHTLGAAILWIPYFLVSERVKNTFVH